MRQLSASRKEGMCMSAKLNTSQGSLDVLASILADFREGSTVTAGSSEMHALQLLQALEESLR